MSNQQFAQTLSDLLKKQVRTQRMNSFESQKRFKQMMKQNSQASPQASFNQHKQNNSQFAKAHHPRSLSQNTMKPPQLLFTNEDGEQKSFNNEQISQISNKGKHANTKNNNPSQKENTDYSHKRNKTQESIKESFTQYTPQDQVKQDLMFKTQQPIELNTSYIQNMSGNKFFSTTANTPQQLSVGIQSPKSNNMSVLINLNYIKSNQQNCKTPKQSQEKSIQKLQNYIETNDFQHEQNQHQQVLSPKSPQIKYNLFNESAKQQDEALQQTKGRFITDTQNEFQKKKWSSGGFSILNALKTNVNRQEKDSTLSPPKSELTQQTKYINYKDNCIRSNLSLSLVKQKQNKFQKNQNESMYSNQTLFPNQIQEGYQQNSQLQQSNSYLSPQNKTQNNQSKDYMDNNHTTMMKDRLQQIHFQQNEKPSQNFIQNIIPSQISLNSRSGNKMSNQNIMNQNALNSNMMNQNTTNQITTNQNLTNQNADLSNETKQQQIEIMLLTNKKINRLALKKEIQEMNQQKQIQHENYVFEKMLKDIQNHQVNHHYTCEQLIETLVGTLKDLSNFKNPKLVIRSLEKSFGYLSKSFEFLGFEQVSNIKELNVEPYLKKLALACSRIENGEVVFRPNKRLLDGLLEITTILEQRLMFCQKDHFNQITNSILEKNQEIQYKEKELEGKYIQTNKKIQFIELRQNMEQKYQLNIRNMETKFINSYKKNKDSFGNFPLLCKRNINICKNIDSVVLKIKQVEQEQQQQQS